MYRPPVREVPDDMLLAPPPRKPISDSERRPTARYIRPGVEGDLSSEEEEGTDRSDRRPPQKSAASKKRIEELQNQLSGEKKRTSDLEAKLSEQSAQMERQKAKYAELEKQLRNMERESGNGKENGKEATQLKKRADDLSKKNEELKRQNEDLTRSLEDAEQKVGEIKETCKKEFDTKLERRKAQALQKLQAFMEKYEEGINGIKESLRTFKASSDCDACPALVDSLREKLDALDAC
mmetsp:Transcript_37837/g.61329  ORF Transcript_37837/g.61329 Transcript_37837/m.61329 type:complete len:237 (+) Transcript_37837:222-932(+)|eukprot:CAMPEP_0184671678 /NCGR_PEP_ID=MMETSP0308-20130426/85643_1 /TAXON_ID=38269 /ORGANISM="Gloeochaete witrockiana, Strain SAG 46.84" /LENGTH=236 /DNA_ID=CAMNT_0027118849 /DNA_START=168 /DNA_END=878 /DNA_ORIENTATION=+